jgi:hypothetical protein
MSRRTRLVLLAYLSAFLSLAALSSPPAAAPAPVIPRSAVEICFCLDTTGSMTGMIDAARLKMWAICHQVLAARPTPQLKVALVAFRDKGDEYVTRVFDLRDDLDAVYADLKTFVATGGGDTPEHVNKALFDAVHKVKWSADTKTLKVIFLVGDAPPHMDYDDDVKYPETCKKARARGILINAVQCGNDDECARYWRDIAARTRGAHVTIPLSGGVRTLATPFDRRLHQINGELVRHTVLFGPAARRQVDEKKLAVAADLPAAVAADRAAYMAREGRAAACDLIDAVRAGKVTLESLPAEELPAPMHKMTVAQRRLYLAGVAKMQADLLREASTLDRQRAGYIAREMQPNRDSFDSQVLELLRKQATSRRLRF